MSDARQKYQPAPLLMNALLQLVKAYKGEIQIDATQKNIGLTSKNEAFLDAAEKTVADIQLAYTRGRLDASFIQRLIVSRLPADLKPKPSAQTFDITVQMPESLTIEQVKTLTNILAAIEDQAPDSCRFDEDLAEKGEHVVYVKAKDGRSFGDIWDVLEQTREQFSAGRSYSPAKVRSVVKEVFGDNYFSTDLKAVRRREQDNTKRSRILTHTVTNLSTINGTDLTALAARLLEKDNKNQPAFGSFANFSSFAQAVTGKDGQPQIQLFLPAYNKVDSERDLEIRNLIEQTIQKVAGDFNDNNDLDVTSDFVASVSFQILSSSDQFIVKTTPFRDLLRLARLTKLGKENTELLELLQDWAPLHRRDIYKNLGADPDNNYHVHVVGRKLMELEENGFLVKRKGVYDLSQASAAANATLTTSAELDDSSREISVQEFLSYTPDAKVEMPQDGIVSGVIESVGGTLYMKATTEGLGRFVLSAESAADVEPGMIVTAKVSAENHNVEAILSEFGQFKDPHAIDKLAALENGMALKFPDNVLEGSLPLVVPEPGPNRKDFRDIPAITIDPITAKDYDDAIYVERTEDGGWKLMVFIADVTHYMQPGTPLFEEAYKRGNSTYLPSMVIPMLPEQLSNGICSLVPDEDRACMVTTMHIDKAGQITSKTMERGLMRSRARFNYDQIQDALEGRGEGRALELYESLIEPANELFNALRKARHLRGALNLDTPEQSVGTTDDGEVHITLEESNNSHGLIEEDMIAANIAAIQLLIEHNSPLIARVHGKPNEYTLDKFADDLKGYGIMMPSSELPVEERVVEILKQAENSPYADEIRLLMIFTQDRAKYSAELKEHFALQLPEYTHQTSPIRRMTDWYIHALINEALNLKDGARLTEAMKQDLANAAKHFSETERFSQQVEESAKNRYVARFMTEHLRETFNATVIRVDKNFVHFSVNRIENAVPARKGEAPANVKIKGKIALKDIQRRAANDAGSFKAEQKIDVCPISADPVTGAIQFALV